MSIVGEFAQQGRSLECLMYTHIKITTNIYIYIEHIHQCLTIGLWINFKDSQDPDKASSVLTARVVRIGYFRD